MTSRSDLTRRELVRRAALACAAIALNAPCDGLLGSRAAHAASGPDYGPLGPAIDRTTGLALLKLPAGFSYASFGWAGEPMAGGGATPPLPDGMGVVQATPARVWLVRNHEVRGPGASFGAPAIAYDPHAGGGTTTLTFDLEHGQWVAAVPSLAGTCTNCAGGVTPWHTWLSCEETVEELGKPHGFVFEVPATAGAVPEPLSALGRFVHEAAAVDPETSIVYQTEDRETAGFYRFVPAVPRALRRGGRLQMLKIRGRDQADLRGGQPAGSEFPVEWVDIEDPTRPHAPGTSDTLGVFSQGRERGGAIFARLEGCVAGDGGIVFTSTTGGAARAGQVWAYDPARDTLRLLYESPGVAIMDMPDNLTVSPRGGIVLCEDNGQQAQRLLGMVAGRTPFVLAENAMVLAGAPRGLRGDFRQGEWTGATFHDRWLFANIQLPGVTFAITGPWERGAL
jgi:secreted PhoX family phosphatase